MAKYFIRHQVVEVTGSGNQELETVLAECESDPFHRLEAAAEEFEVLTGTPMDECMLDEEDEAETIDQEDSNIPL